MKILTDLASFLKPLGLEILDFYPIIVDIVEKDFSKRVADSWNRNLTNNSRLIRAKYARGTQPIEVALQDANNYLETEALALLLGSQLPQRSPAEIAIEQRRLLVLADALSGLAQGDRGAVADFMSQEARGHRLLAALAVDTKGLARTRRWELEVAGAYDNLAASLRG